MIENQKILVQMRNQSQGSNQGYGYGFQHPINAPSFRDDSDDEIFHIPSKPKPKPQNVIEDDDSDESPKKKTVKIPLRADGLPDMRYIESKKLMANINSGGSQS